MKNLITWCESKNLQIIELDQQHRIIADVINKLFHFLQLPDDAESNQEIKEYMAKLIQATENHFQCEEDYMKQCNYPDFKNHRREHLMLKAELKEYSREVIKGRLKLNKKVLQALKNWLVSHIMCSDMDFAKHFHKKKINGYN